MRKSGDFYFFFFFFPLLWRLILIKFNYWPLIVIGCRTGAVCTMPAARRLVPCLFWAELRHDKRGVSRQYRCRTFCTCSFVFCFEIFTAFVGHSCKQRVKVSNYLHNYLYLPSSYDFVSIIFEFSQSIKLSHIILNYFRFFNTVFINWVPKTSEQTYSKLFGFR